MKKLRITYSVLIIFLIFLIQGCSGNKAEALIAVEQVDNKISLSNDYFSGQIEALDSVDITPKVGGKVAQVLVDIGSQVVAGQVLITMDMPELVAQQKQYQAAVNNSQAGLKRARVDLANASDNYQRGEQLYKQGLLSKADFENRYAHPQEQARIMAEESAPQVLAQAMGALESINSSYNNGIITSPINGEITGRYVDPGEICKNNEAVLKVDNMSRLTVVAHVDQKKINDLKIGQKVSVKIDSLENLLEAKIDSIGYDLDPMAKGYLVRVLLSEAGAKVKPGMFAKVYTDVGTENRFIVSKNAIHQEGKGYVGYLYEEGKVRKISLGIEKIGEKLAVVKDGLKNGQNLVIYSNIKLKDGMTAAIR
ncbi:MAG: efflux RND transporter periplasmic adaptor subunit [Peptococcaceae bacterium]|nr:efflux RND transporter periplasmic adaptor subunit [Peptococcaceae bacterium]